MAARWPVPTTKKARRIVEQPLDLWIFTAKDDRLAVFLNGEPAQQRRFSAASAATVEHLVGCAEVGLRLRPDIRNEGALRGTPPRLCPQRLFRLPRQRPDSRENVVEGLQALHLCWDSRMEMTACCRWLSAFSKVSGPG
jgi:hypothetical protein